jgi:hypothetical protein
MQQTPPETGKTSSGTDNVGEQGTTGVNVDRQSGRRLIDARRECLEGHKHEQPSYFVK